MRYQLDYSPFSPYSTDDFDELGCYNEPMIDYIPFREQEKESSNDINFSTANCHEDDWSLDSPFDLFNNQPRLPGPAEYILDWYNPSESYRKKSETRRTKNERHLTKENLWLANDRTITFEEPEIISMEAQCMYIESKEQAKEPTLAEEAKNHISLDSLKTGEDKMLNSKTLNVQANKERELEDLNPITEKKKCCNCKNSKCLKLYCECFASQGYCSGCNCVDCHNTPASRQEIKAIIAKIKKKNPIGIMRNQGTKESSVGCNCKKSECRRNYCYCYKNNKKCGEYCKCVDCKNCLNEQSTL